jgi:hypothetical protein
VQRRPVPVGPRLAAQNPPRDDGRVVDAEAGEEPRVGVAADAQDDRVRRAREAVRQVAGAGEVVPRRDLDEDVRLRPRDEGDDLLARADLDLGHAIPVTRRS